MDRAGRISGFLTRTGWAEARRSRVAGDASNRSYDRLTQTDGRTAILMDAPPERGEDVRPFVRIADHLRAAGLSAPDILQAEVEAGLLLIEDFGDAQFAGLIAADPAQTEPLYQAACDVLLALRGVVPPADLPLCDAHWLTDMVAPVFEWYAPEAGPAAADRFAESFRPLAERAAQGAPVLMLRDYHVENLMLLPGRAGVARVGLLDFQDAMQGPAAYDLVSILQDARRDVGKETEEEALAYYLRRSQDDAERFVETYAILGLQRNLRILGIFARLCLRDGKARYVDMIPRVWGYVQRNLGYPSLQGLSDHLATALPEPTPDFLERMKQQCPTKTSPS